MEVKAEDGIPVGNPSLHKPKPLGQAAGWEIQGVDEPQVQFPQW